MVKHALVLPQLERELSELIEVLDAQIPANPRSAKNQRLAKRFERELAKYFRSLEDAFPYNEIARIYNCYMKESLGSETRDILDPLLAAFDTTLKAKLVGHLTTIYLSGQAEVISYGKTKMGIPILYEGPPPEVAIRWAEKHCATLVKGLDAESKSRLANMISNGLKEKRGVPGLSRDIRNTFGDMSKYRSELIARTETANALSQSSLDSMKDMGIEGKEWITAGDERVSIECSNNEGEGVIPRDQMFSGGVMAPPQHPACRCSLAPAILRK